MIVLHTYHFNDFTSKIEYYESNIVWPTSLIIGISNENTKEDGKAAPLKEATERYKAQTSFSGYAYSEDLHRGSSRHCRSPRIRGIMLLCHNGRGKVQYDLKADELFYILREIDAWLRISTAE